MGSVYDSTTDTVEVVVKMASSPTAISELEAEDGTYRQLDGLQGKSIPECYGLYNGMIDGVPYKCLLLEYCNPDKGLAVTYNEKLRWAPSFLVKISVKLIPSCLDAI